ncbi:putative beta-lysine N-acetyltransferase [Ectobacillus polymachus]|uniref:putative beta-lysine N-acetyltransferase n=1 Tax=Ectobacillus polymachus TaxID=1508806 RepID=UPI003A8731BB
MKVKEQDVIYEGVIDYYNERVRIDTYSGNGNTLVEVVDKLTMEIQATKQILQVRKEQLLSFLRVGYMIEAIIPGYFLGSDGYYLAKYRTNDRRNSNYWLKEEEILASVRQLVCTVDGSIPLDYKVRKATTADCDELASLYRTVFQIYPTPLHDVNYIRKTMTSDTDYFVVEKDGVIVSTASAEINSLQRNAEITNCATLQEHRKQGLMKALVKSLEEELVHKSIFCIFSIARSLSYGINATFQQLGYQYQGRLTNNCYIYDKLEDMNVWVKDLSI